MPQQQLSSFIDLAKKNCEINKNIFKASSAKEIFYMTSFSTLYNMYKSIITIGFSMCVDSNKVDEMGQ